MLLLHQTPTPPTQSAPRPVGVEPRRQGQDAADVARRRQIANVLARKRRHLTRVLHVNGRRLAVTVTVSASWPTVIVALTGAVNPVVSTTLFCCCLVNPSSVKVT